MVIPLKIKSIVQNEHEKKTTNWEFRIRFWKIQTANKAYIALSNKSTFSASSLDWWYNTKYSNQARNCYVYTYHTTTLGFALNSKVLLGQVLI